MVSDTGFAPEPIETASPGVDSAASAVRWSSPPISCASGRLVAIMWRRALERISREQCCEIVAASESPLGSLRPIFPAPAGGLSLSRVPEVQQVYGRELIILVGGGLFKHGPDLVENCRYFRKMIESI